MPLIYPQLTVSGYGITVAIFPLTFLLSAETSGLFNLVGGKAWKAASAIASVFATKTPVEPPLLTQSSSNRSSDMDENNPPLLSPSSSNGSSATDSTSSHAGEVDTDNDNTEISAQCRPFRVCLVPRIYHCTDCLRPAQEPYCQL